MRTAVTGSVSGRRLALQITRRSRPLTSGRWRTETVYAMTDLTAEQTTAAELADALRGHRGIGNRLHWVRDVAYGEGLSQIRAYAWNIRARCDPCRLVRHRSVAGVWDVRDGPILLVLTLAAGHGYHRLALQPQEPERLATEIREWMA